jgi:hypothetical protein
MKTIHLGYGSIKILKKILGPDYLYLVCFNDLFQQYTGLVVEVSLASHRFTNPHEYTGLASLRSAFPDKAPL